METKSWVIRVRATGQVLMETFNPELVRILNSHTYEAVPILAYLQEFNRLIKERDQC